MTPSRMAAIHARAMTEGRAWTKTEFATLLASPHVYAISDDGAFALGRVAADEAELLTLAVDPARQRRGLGRRCLAGFEHAARERGARVAFLEVATGNHRAIALYRSAGFQSIGYRSGYYRQGGDKAADAEMFRKMLVRA